MLFIFIIVLPSLGGARGAVHRDKRFLLFPRQAPTRLQFIGGFGIPLPLERESVTTGYVLRGQYYLPYNATQLYPDFAGTNPITKLALASGTQLWKRSIVEKHEGEFKVLEESPIQDRSRQFFYDAVITTMEAKGLPGKPCLLRAICESARHTFGYHSGVLGEILHILLSPSSATGQSELLANLEFAAAESLGKTQHVPCERLYAECTSSVIDLISEIDL